MVLILWVLKFDLYKDFTIQSLGNFRVWLADCVLINVVTYNGYLKLMNKVLVGRLLRLYVQFFLYILIFETESPALFSV